MEPWVTVVLLGAAIIGIALLRPKKESSAGGAAIQDIETALEQFAGDLQEENQELIKFIAELKRELEADINKLNGRVDVLERAGHQPPMQAGATSQAVQQAAVIFSPPPAAAAASAVAAPEQAAPRVNEASIRHRYSSVLALHEQGKSIDYIAKKNGMNKGEVQLIIQLAKQEEKFRD